MKTHPSPESNPLLARLRHHVTGAIERGEAQPIAGIPAQPIAAQSFHFHPVRPRSNFDKEHREVSLLGTLGDFSSVRVEVSGRNSATVAQVKDLIAACPELLAALEECNSYLRTYRPDAINTIAQARAALARAKGAT